MNLCGCIANLGDGTASMKLPTNRPKVLIKSSPQGYSMNEVWDWYDEASSRWASVCDWKSSRILRESEIGMDDFVNLITVSDLGTGGVLADQMLPFQGARVLRMRLNSRIKWKATDGVMVGSIDPIRTICHEIGHFMGHLHWPVGRPWELMEPTISDSIISPQPTEGRVSSGWFGSPVLPEPPPNPTPNPTPTPKRHSVTITFLSDSPIEGVLSKE